jgi:hypothetical protein
MISKCCCSAVLPGCITCVLNLSHWLQKLAGPIQALQLTGLLLGVLH